jgi:hypothetical protein
MPSNSSQSEQIKAAIEYARKTRRNESIPFQAMDQRISIRQNSVKDIIALWHQRQRLNNEFEAEIEARETQLQTALYEMENSGNTTARLNLEAQMSGLFRQSMQHRLDLFHDKLTLTRELHREEEGLLALWPFYILRNQTSAKKL